MSQYPYIKLVVPTALKQYKNGQLAESVLASVKTSPSSFQYASDQLKNDKAFVKEVLISGGAEAFDYVSDALKADKSIINLYKSKPELFMENQLLKRNQGAIYTLFKKFKKVSI